MPPAVTRGALAPLLAALTVALAGCGSSAETKQDYTARANAICATAIRNVRNVATPSATGDVSLPALARYLRAVTPIVESELKQLRALPKPAADRALLDRYLAALAAAASQYKALASAAMAGDHGSMNAATAALQSNQDASLAARYGLTSCTGATGTAPTS